MGDFTHFAAMAAIMCCVSSVRARVEPPWVRADQLVPQAPGDDRGGLGLPAPQRAARHVAAHPVERQAGVAVQAVGARASLVRVEAEHRAEVERVVVPPLLARCRTSRPAATGPRSRPAPPAAPSPGPAAARRPAASSRTSTAGRSVSGLRISRPRLPKLSSACRVNRTKSSWLRGDQPVPLPVPEQRVGQQQQRRAVLRAAARPTGRRPDPAAGAAAGPARSPVITSATRPNCSNSTAGRPGAASMVSAARCRPSRWRRPPPTAGAEQVGPQPLTDVERARPPPPGNRASAGRRPWRRAPGRARPASTGSSSTASAAA